MKKTILIALTAAAAAISVFSCNKETLPPVTGVSFQMDSVAFWGSEPGLIIKSRTRGLEVTLSVLIDGKTAFCDAEPYAIGEDGCDTLRIDEPLGIGEHTLHAVALGCCGRYVSQDLEFRVLPSLEARTSNIFYDGNSSQLLLLMKPDGYSQQSTVTEADDEVMSTVTKANVSGFSIAPTLRSYGESSVLIECLGHTYTVPLEYRQRWAAVSALENAGEETMEF